MLRNRNLSRTLIAVFALALSAFAFTACGYESHETEVTEGEPVRLGDLTYNAIFSRFLNPNDNEDEAYLVGQPPLKPGYSYFGVFFEVQNESKKTQFLPDHFKVTDTDHQEFKSLESESIFAFPFGGEVEPEEQIPVLDSAAQQGAIEGSVVIFKLPVEAGENRPLILEIPGPGGPAEVTLDV